jgi:hypothetical protein
MRSIIAIILFFSGLFLSCEKKEIPVAPRLPGDVNISQVNLGSNYGNQIYYRLYDDSIISINDRSIWDLSFESSNEGWHVLINSSKGMKVSFFEGADFQDDLSLANVDWNYDASTGNLDSTAIGNWRSANGIYVIDRGYSTTGSFYGNRKFTVNSVNEDSFTIEFSDLNGNNHQLVEIQKNKNLNYTQFSFENGVTQVEPDKDTWDFLFTQYTYVFTEIEEVTPYQVTGVLLNPNNVQAFSLDTLHLFEDIDLEFASSLDLSTELDEIGYDWKNFDLNGTGKYEVFHKQVYIIRDLEGIYYKLHFTDFYTDSGVKGSPKFEFQKL